MMGPFGLPWVPGVEMALMVQSLVHPAAVGSSVLHNFILAFPLLSWEQVSL